MPACHASNRKKDAGLKYSLGQMILLIDFSVIIIIYFLLNLFFAEFGMRSVRKNLISHLNTSHLLLGQQINFKKKTSVILRCLNDDTLCRHDLIRVK